MRRLTKTAFCGWMEMRLIGVCLVAGLAGCSTMVHGTTQVLPVTSNPPGELVTVDDVPVGVTPLRVTLSRERTHVVLVGSDSAKTAHYAVSRQVSAWVLANAFVYYLPALVDFGSGGGRRVLQAVGWRWPWGNSALRLILSGRVPARAAVVSGAG